MLRYLSVEFRGFAVSRRLLRTVAVLPLFTIGSLGISAFAQTSKSELEPLADADVVPQKAETVQEDLVQSDGRVNIASTLEILSYARMCSIPI